MVMDKEILEARDAKRDIAAEWLEAADEIASNRRAAVAVPDASGKYTRSELARVRSVLDMSQSVVNKMQRSGTWHFIPNEALFFSSFPGF